MKAKVELYGKQISVKNNITRLFIEKEAKLLLTITNNDSTARHEFIINREAAVALARSIVKSLNDPVLKKNGFKVV